MLPVVAGLSALAPVSVDTMRAEVAEAALDAGAGIVNDVSGGLADPDMAPLVAERGVPMVAMHWRGHSADMQDRARYDDVVDDVRRELGERVEALVGAGIRPDDILLDPGLGLRQARGPQLGAPASPRRAHRARAPARARHVAQAVPRPGRPHPRDRAPAAGP